MCALWDVTSKDCKEPGTTAKDVGSYIDVHIRRKSRIPDSQYCIRDCREEGKSCWDILSYSKT